MNREVHVRFWERFWGEIPPYLLDYFKTIPMYKLSRLVLILVDRQGRAVNLFPQTLELYNCLHLNCLWDVVYSDVWAFYYISNLSCKQRQQPRFILTQKNWILKFKTIGNCWHYRKKTFLNYLHLWSWPLRLSFILRIVNIVIKRIFSVVGIINI